jgi:RHS repeat-associated protein
LSFNLGPNLGSNQRSTELPSGAIAVGARSYIPTLGRFLQVDPVDGGSVNPYNYTNQDPLNQTDLSGLATAPGKCIQGRKGYAPARCKAGRVQTSKKPPRGAPKPHVTKKAVCKAAGLAIWLVPGEKVGAAAVKALEIAGGVSVLAC